MPVLKKLLSIGIEKAVGSVTNLYDTVVTSKEEKLEKRNELTKVLTENVNDIINSQKEILITEMKGNWLQKSWRPIIMLTFGFIVFYHYFITQVFEVPVIELPGQFWDLLELGIGGYVIARSAEKIASSVIGNVSIKRK